MRLGLVPATIGPFALASIGRSQARALFLTGARFDAARARAIGLVHELHADDAALDAARRAHVAASPARRPGGGARRQGAGRRSARRRSGAAGASGPPRRSPSGAPPTRGGRGSPRSSSAGSRAGESALRLPRRRLPRRDRAAHHPRLPRARHQQPSRSSRPTTRGAHRRARGRRRRRGRRPTSTPRRSPSRPRPRGAAGAASRLRLPLRVGRARRGLRAPPALVFVGPPPGGARDARAQGRARASCAAPAPACPSLPGGRRRRGGRVTPCSSRPRPAAAGAACASCARPPSSTSAVEAAAREAEAAFGDGASVYERYLDGAAPRRGADPARRARRRRAPRRARLLGAAPPPEGDRGGARARRRPRAARRRSAPRPLRLAEAVGYVGAGTAEFLLDAGRQLVLPRDERAHPGRAPGDRARHGHRPRRAGSSRSPPAGRSALRAGATSRCADTRSRPASTPRTRARLPAHLRHACSPCAGRAAPASAWTPASTAATSSARATTASWPSSACTARRGRARSRGCARRSTTWSCSALTTNLPLLRCIAGDPDFAQGGVDTGWLERTWQPAGGRGPPDEALAAADGLRAGRDRRRARGRGAGAPVFARRRPRRPVARGADGALHVWCDGRDVRIERPALDEPELHARRSVGGGGRRHRAHHRADAGRRAAARRGRGRRGRGARQRCSCSRR